MKIIVIPVTPFQQNSSLLICEETGRAASVDPGGDLPRMEAELARHGATLEKVLLTHAHLDHCGGAHELAQRHGVPIEGPHRDDQFLLDSLPQQCQRFGFGTSPAFLPERWLDEGDSVTVGARQYAVRHCPGHTPGHVIFFDAAERLALVGDVLFAGSVGRTDFPRGSHADLIRSITGKLWPLGDDVTFVPGHGDVSTFGAERRSNPYAGDAATGYRDPS